jgi:hypothetical protein
MGKRAAEISDLIRGYEVYLSSEITALLGELLYDNVNVFCLMP